MADRDERQGVVEGHGFVCFGGVLFSVRGWIMLPPGDLRSHSFALMAVGIHSFCDLTILDHELGEQIRSRVKSPRYSKESDCRIGTVAESFAGI